MNTIDIVADPMQLYIFASLFTTCPKLEIRGCESDPLTFCAGSSGDDQSNGETRGGVGGGE